LPERPIPIKTDGEKWRQRFDARFQRRSRLQTERKFLTMATSKEFPFSEEKMITSKLTSKAQTTIPQPVRAALELQEGDELLYEIVDQRVILTKVRQGDLTDDPFRVFSEWRSEADEKAYGDL